MRQAFRYSGAKAILLLLIVALVAACGGSPAADQQADTDDEETTAEAEPETATSDDEAADDEAADEAADDEAADEAADDDEASDEADDEASDEADDEAADDEASDEAADEAADDDEATDEADDEAADDEVAVEADDQAYTTPHPILSDLRVRQAIAHCTNRPQLVESVYPFLTPEEQENLLMDTFLPQGHWALAPEDMITTYPFDPQQGQELLQAAGWTLPEDADIRVNDTDEPLVLDLLTTNAQFRQTWATVFEQQMLENCGIQINRTHAPGSYVFGQTSGLSRREFELGAFAWVGSPDPKGTTLYSCDHIPLPSNNWEGQNYMGWCNEEASRAILAANNTLDREERIEQFAIVQREFTADMVSLPLFSRLSVAAARNNLLNFRPDPTDYFTANIDEWAFDNNEEILVIGMTQEPDTMFTVVDSFASTIMLTYLIKAAEATTYNYDYQPKALTRLPTVENGGATLSEVEVQEGDLVWTVEGEAAELAPGVELTNAAGETVVYESGTVTMTQLAVTFEYVDGITWEDGEPLTSEDFALAERISCAPDVGAVSYRLCESRQDVAYESDTQYTITYVPGALWPEYFVYSIGHYPAHQVLSDGRRLSEVPASEWATLKEIAETPLSTGPYRIVEWQKGQRITFEANPYYFGGEPTIKNVTVSFIENTNQAVAQLLGGSVDALGGVDLSGGAEVETVLQAGEEGLIQAYSFASPTWEHIDMNLYTE